jgi:hypothetical protein
LKTIEGHTSGGSNPSLSANLKAFTLSREGFFYFPQPSLLAAAENTKSPVWPQAKGFSIWYPSRNIKGSTGAAS